jgi:hypothetical protein
MAESKAISIRVPDILLEKIDRLANEKYKSHKGTPNRSLVILDAIVAYFDTLSDTDNADELITVSDNVSTVEFRELQNIVIAMSDSVRQLKDKLFTASDSVDNAPDPKPDLIEIATVSETEPEPKLLTLNMEALAKRLKTTEKTLRAKAASDVSWREFMKSKPDPESLRWARPIKVSNVWRIACLPSV